MDILVTPDGLRLHLRRWPAPNPLRAHGTVLVVHGLGEHSGRYAALAATLNDAGWHVASYDQRGHGRSEGPRGAIANASSLLSDLGEVIDHVRGRGRLVLLGHSLGGLVAARFVAEGLAKAAARWQRDVDGLVLSSPAFDPGLGPLQRLLLALLPGLLPNLSLGNGLKPAWICSDPAVVEEYQADPLVHDRITPRLARFVHDAGRAVLARAPAWRQPTLLLWAGADRCVRPEGSRAFAAAAPDRCVTAFEFPGAAHELFNEPDREQVLQALLQFLHRDDVPLRRQAGR